MTPEEEEREKYTKLGLAVHGVFMGYYGLGNGDPAHAPTVVMAIEMMASQYGIDLRAYTPEATQ